MKKILFGALSALLLSAGSTVPSAAEPADARVAKAAQSLLAGRSAGGTASSAASAGDDGSAGAAEVRSGGDATGDVPYCGGDLVGWSANLAAVSQFTATTACSVNPTTSANWNPGGTAIGWFVESDGDEEPEYLVIYIHDTEEVIYGVFRIADAVVTCGGAGGWDGDRTYSASFDASCLGSPSVIRLGVLFEWDEAANPDTCTCPQDFAPEEDWAGPIYSGMPPVPGAGGSGYWMLGQKGAVYAFGDARHYGNANVGGANAMDIASNPADNAGYWIVDDQGHVFSHGSAPWLGNVSLHAGERSTTIVGTATGNGYYVFTDRGRTIRFGDAVHRGDMAGVPLNGPVLDSTLTGAGDGYYMVGADGGVFSFNADFHGSMGGKPLNKPVNGISGDPDNVGYWLVASDGGIFAFNAPFKGSMGGQHLNRPVVGMVAYGDGYLLVASDGGIFNFSSKLFRGSLGSSPPAIPIKSVAPIR